VLLFATTDPPLTLVVVAACELDKAEVEEAAGVGAEVEAVSETALDTAVEVDSATVVDSAVEVDSATVVDSAVEVTTIESVAVEVEEEASELANHSALGMNLHKYKG
jgi:hypothetical protein